MTRALVLTVSTRAAAGEYADETGPVIVDWLGALGHEVWSQIVADGTWVELALHDAAGEGIDLVVTTGGTGISPTDRTPEATRKVVEVELSGWGEELRRRGAAKTPSALLTRATAGVVGNTLIVNLPGSAGGVRDGLEVLDGFLSHALEQLAGGDHERSATSD